MATKSTPAPASVSASSATMLSTVVTVPGKMKYVAASPKAAKRAGTSGPRAGRVRKDVSGASVPLAWP